MTWTLLLESVLGGLAMSVVGCAFFSLILIAVTLQIPSHREVWRACGWKSLRCILFVHDDRPTGDPYERPAALHSRLGEIHGSCRVQMQECRRCGWKHEEMVGMFEPNTRSLQEALLVTIEGKYWKNATVSLDGYSFRTCRFDNCLLVGSEFWEMRGCFLEDCRIASMKPAPESAANGAGSLTAGP